jgi:hypothetical protein
LPRKSLDYLNEDHPVHRVNRTLLSQLREAQRNLLHNAFKSARELCEAACEGAKVNSAIADRVTDLPLYDFADSPHRQHIVRLSQFAEECGVDAEGVERLADYIQLLRAFPDPAKAVADIRVQVERKVANFPNNAADIECGRNPGDVLDPFLVSAVTELLAGSDFALAIELTAGHKAMMMIEDMAGHLHEGVIGEMRGNIRVPEPAGEDKEMLHPDTNPFPGADVAQPPWKAGDSMRFFQVKSKTGTAKGGDAPRVAQQLDRLRLTYHADVFFCSVVGPTLRGHRSMSGMLNAAPNIVVLTGATALEALTGTRIGGELLLRTYQNAFRQVAEQSNYRIRDVATAIVQEFVARTEAGEQAMEVILQSATEGPRQEQDSRTHGRRRRGQRGA